MYLKIYFICDIIGVKYGWGSEFGALVDGSELQRFWAGVIGLGSDDFL